MPKKLLFLLLLPAFSAFSEPLITCESDPVEYLDTYFWPFCGYIFLVFLFLASIFSITDDNMKLKLTPWRSLLFLLGMLSATTLFVYLTRYTINLTPGKRTVINENVFFSSPDAARGKHFDSDCVVISQNTSSVDLSCKPDARTESVSLAEYNQALNALKTAREHIQDLTAKVGKNNLCTH